MANFSGPIEPVGNLGGAVSFLASALIEEATQTFVAWTPVQINATDGGVQAWDGTTVANAIAGFAMGNASNLATTGAGAPQGFTPVLGPGSVIGSYPANPNQPLAVITPPGVPINDGLMYFAVAVSVTVFVGNIGTTGSVIATNNNQVGVKYGLTKDTNNYWYVDTAKTGGSAVVEIVKLDPRYAPGTAGGLVWFTVLPAAAQLQGS